MARADAPFIARVEDLPGDLVGVPAAWALAATWKARYPRQPLIEYRNIDEFAAGVESGRAYAAVATLEHAADLVDKSTGRLRIIAKLDDPYPISVAVRNDEPELLPIMQQAIDATTPAERDQINQRRTTFRIEQGLDLTRLWQVLGVLGLIGLSLAWRQWELTRLNRRLVVARDAAEVGSRAKVTSWRT